MTDNRTTELLCKLLDERGVEWWDSRYGEQVVFQVGEVKWFANDGCRDGMVELSTILITPEQAIAATLGNEREAKLIRAMEDVLRHATDTVWVGEAETLVDRMVSLGVYKHDVYEGVRPWEATNER